MVVHGVQGLLAAQDGPIELLLAKVQKASGRIGIFYLIFMQVPEGLRLTDIEGTENTAQNRQGIQSHIEPSQEDQQSPSGGHSSDENVIDNLPIVAVEVIPVEIEKMVTRPQTYTEGMVVQGNNEELQTITTESPTGQ